MNLFLLSWNPKKCAIWHCDKHVVKMILESVQMLYTAWHINNGGVPDSAPNGGYKKISNHNHPMAKWVRESEWNYNFCVQVCAGLCLEYTFRYKKTHASTQHLLWLSDNLPTLEHKHKTMTPQCMPDEYKVDGDPVRAYRNYYNGDKSRFAKWSKRDTPPWYKILYNCK